MPTQGFPLIPKKLPQPRPELNPFSRRICSNDIKKQSRFERDSAGVSIENGKTELECGYWCLCLIDGLSKRRFRTLCADIKWWMIF